MRSTSLILAVLVASPAVLGTGRRTSTDGVANQPIVKCSRTIAADDGPLRCVAFSPDGKVVATCGDRFVQLFDVKTGERLRRIEGHTGAVNAVAFSPDGKLLATGSHDGTVGLWDAETGKSVRRFEGHSKEVFSIAFSPDGKHVASAGADKFALVWDVTKE